jgi:hypothetical protein
MDFVCACLCVCFRRAHDMEREREDAAAGSCEVDLGLNDDDPKHTLSTWFCRSTFLSLFTALSADGKHIDVRISFKVDESTIFYIHFCLVLLSQD